MQQKILKSQYIFHAKFKKLILQYTFYFLETINLTYCAKILLKMITICCSLFDVTYPALTLLTLVRVGSKNLPVFLYHIVIETVVTDGTTSVRGRGVAAL